MLQIEDRIRIWELLACVGFLVLDLLYLWPQSHQIAFWSAVLAVSITVAVLIPRFGIPIALAVVVVGAVGSRYLPPTETETHGWLLPGNESVPHVACGPPGAVQVFFGNCNVAFVASTNRQFDIVRMGDTGISVQRTDHGLSVSAKFFTENGVVVEILNNEFTINPNTGWKIKRPDLHTLTVHDNWDRVVAKIKYLNPSAIQFSGRLYYPGQNPFVFEECLSGPDGNCFGESRGAAIEFGPKRERPGGGPAN